MKNYRLTILVALLLGWMGGSLQAAEHDLLDNARRLYALGKKKEAVEMCKIAAEMEDADAQLQLAKWLSSIVLAGNANVPNPKPDRRFDDVIEDIDRAQDLQDANNKARGGNNQPKPGGDQPKPAIGVAGGPNRGQPGSGGT